MVWLHLLGNTIDPLSSRRKCIAMPRYVHAQFRWSEQTQSYILFTDNQEHRQALSNDWLEQTTSFSFHSRQGMHYTVRKQKAQRGSSYWYAYRRLHGRVTKRYLGSTANLTFARLEEIAHLLEGIPDTRQHANERHQETSQSQSILSNTENPSPQKMSPLLFSRLSPPRLHAFLLDRSRLLALLDAGLAYPLTLISAPAGSGKTTLVSQWMAARRTQPDFPAVAWLSLEATDNDPLRFWHYLITACQAFQADLQETYTALQASNPQPPFMISSLESMLIALLNALTRCSSQGILVLEDFHVITTPQIHETISFFLDHLPATIRLIIITRNDSPLPLVRLRAHNVLHEIRAADLHFSQEEASLLLHQSLPFPLADETLQRLHTQLEGWAVGLHLTKLALQRITTPVEEKQILTLFFYNNASFQEYFVTEVLHLQSEPLQLFLLKTSILSRLTPSLCDAVTEQQNSLEMLTSLERIHLFLEPLHTSSTARQWYRYHALFSEAMRNEAQQRFGADYLHSLFARASCWYETHGYSDEAIDMALHAQDFTRAAILIEQSIATHTPLGQIYEPHTLQRWLEELPMSILEQHPILGLSYAIILLFQNNSWQPAPLSINRIEHLLNGAEERFREELNLPKLGELSVFRSLLALRQGNPQAAINLAQQALEMLPLTQHTWRGPALCIASEEWIKQGQFQQARTVLLEAYTLCEDIANHYFQWASMVKLAQVLYELGEFQQAISWYRQVLPSARAQENIYALCNTLSGLATLSYAYNDLENASQYALEAIAISQSHHFVYHEVQATLILARIQQAQGVAQQQLTALLEKIPPSLSHLTHEIQAAQACLALSSGDIVTRLPDRLPHTNFSQEMDEELLFSRWLRAQGKLEEASHQLERLLTVTRQTGNIRRVLEIQVETILVTAANKRKAEALQLLHKVLTQALACNAIRLFLDAGEQMAILLRTLLPQVHAQSIRTYIRTLLNAFPAQSQSTATTLIEPLSPQETRVLRLLAQHRSNADIASELVVSVNTIRSQVQSIYSKLGVHTRSAASEIAHELHLIS